MNSPKPRSRKNNKKDLRYCVTVKNQFKNDIFSFEITDVFKPSNLLVMENTEDIKIPFETSCYYVRIYKICLFLLNGKRKIILNEITIDSAPLLKECFIVFPKGSISWSPTLGKESPKQD